MLRFIARRRWLFAAALLIVLAAAVVFFSMRPQGTVSAALSSAAVILFGFGGVAIARLAAAIREAFKHLTDLTEENGRLRSRLTLAERRLAMLAIKLDQTDTLDEPRP